MKRLADFPKGEWIKAADICPSCGEAIFVKIDYVAEDGNFGHVTVKKEHLEGCIETYDYDTNIIEFSDFAGWSYSKDLFKVAGKVLTAFNARSNIGICSYCERFIVGVPLILFPADGEFELDFCDDCVKETGLIKEQVPPHDDDDETRDY